MKQCLKEVLDMQIDMVKNAIRLESSSESNDYINKKIDEEILAYKDFIINSKALTDKEKMVLLGS